MARHRTIHRCSDCGSASPRWAGRCPACGEWNTLVEEVESGPRSPGRSSPASVPAIVDLAAITEAPVEAVPTGLGELDRVLSGGLVPGSATLIGGEPGIGKSTLLLQAAAEMARRGGRCLMVSAEESPSQVRLRAARLDAAVPGLWLVGASALPEIEAAIGQIGPDLVIVDSIQTVWDPDVESAAGSVAQVRGCAQRLVASAKSGGPPVVLVGHVTKDGALAGPRVLEHLVDTVLSFEGDRHHAVRILRAVKHRFGPTGQLGLFEMTPSGLAAVEDAGALFLADRRPGTAGSVVFAAMEGRRPILLEIQALVVDTHGESPRRAASGFDPSRLALLLAVLDRRAGLPLGRQDVYVSVIGGVRIADPGADLAVCLALASAHTRRPVGDDVVVIGEVGLGGEVRQVAHTPARLAEAARLGFIDAVVPPNCPVQTGMTIRRTAMLTDALERHLGPVSSPPKLRLVGDTVPA